MAVRFLQSDLARENRENGPKFANLQEGKSRNSLQSRLRGGGEGFSYHPFTYLLLIPAHSDSISIGAAFKCLCSRVYSFYSFSYSLQFCAKWYQRYQQ
jgi:hypothetical protein